MFMFMCMLFLMDNSDSKVVINDVKNYIMDKPVVTCVIDGVKVEDHVNGEDDSDSNSLLPPRRGCMSRNCDKTRRNVQWNDKNGNKLAEVLEYEPSDVSDSEDDEDSDSCICTIM